jgi:hypothetical protein
MKDSLSGCCFFALDDLDDDWHGDQGQNSQSQENYAAHFLFKPIATFRDFLCSYFSFCRTCYALAT